MENGGQHTRCCSRAGERVYHLNLLRFCARTGASFKMECSWKVEESIEEPIFTQIYREKSQLGCNVIDMVLKGKLK